MRRRLGKICTGTCRVAEMPSEPGEMRQIAAADFDQRLRFEHHIDNAAVVEFKRIAVAQQHGFRSMIPITVPFTPVRCAVCMRR